MAYEATIADLDFFSKAMTKLVPDAESYNIIAGKNGDSKTSVIVDWSDDRPQPTSAAIQAEFKIQEDAYNKLKYSRERKWEYDQLNQLELISDDAINGTTTHADAIAAIKTKWPKNNTGPV